MLQPIRLWITFLLFTFSIGLAAPPAAHATDSAELRVLSTTDLHMYLMDYDYYRDAPDQSLGLVRTATLIKAARAEKPNVMLFDSGDLLQGNPMGDYVRQRGLKGNELHPAYAVMKELGYDAAVIGNHEFNFGLPFLERAVKGVPFPLLGGNVFKLNDKGQATGPLFKPYVVVTKKIKDANGKEWPLKVGLVGVLTPQITRWDADKLKGKVITSDLLTAAAANVAAARSEGAEVVILLAHSGIGGPNLEPMIENGGYHLAKIPGVDALLTGHSHQPFPSGPQGSYTSLPGVDGGKGLIHGVPTVMARFFGSDLGVIDLTLARDNGKWSVTGGTAALRRVQTRNSEGKNVAVPADQALVQLLKPWHDGTVKFVNAPVATAADHIHTYFALLGDVSSQRLVADVQARYVAEEAKGTEWEGLPILSAVAPFKVGGNPGPTYYTDIPAGPMAMKNVADLYIYPNIIQAVKLNGAEIADYLEATATVFNQIDPAKSGPQELVNTRVPAYGFDAIAGLTYEIDLTQPARYDREGKTVSPGANRIKNIRFNGKPLDPAQVFLVAMNNYRANGGGNFPRMDGSTVVIRGHDTVQNEIAADFAQQGKVKRDRTPIWSFAKNLGKAELVFDVGPGGKALADADPRLTYLEMTPQGFARYRVKLD